MKDKNKKDKKDKRVSVKTGTMSVRLPLDVIKHFDSVCKQEGIAKNKAIKDLMIEKQYAKMGKGGLLTPNYKIPPMLENAIIGLGSAGVGYAVYHLVKAHFPLTVIDDEEDRESLAILLGITGAVAMGYGLLKMIKTDE